jgi:hypothetical protein
MDKCPDCGSWTHQVRKTFFRTILYSDMNVCTGCGLRLMQYRRYAAALVRHWRFIFSVHTACPDCGSRSVLPATYSDRASKVRHPLGWIQSILFAPLLECDYCRHQYYDWRPRRKVGAVAQTRPATLLGDLTALNQALNDSVEGRGKRTHPADAPIASGRSEETTAAK